MLPTLFLSSLLRKYAPCFFSSSTTWFLITSSVTIDCSEAQITPLSKVLLSIILLTAFLISALLSINAGPFPGPTPIAGVPELYAAFTIASPPVARINEVFLCFISSCVACNVGVFITPISPFGAPFLSAAFIKYSAVLIIQSFAFGCGLTITAFPAFNAIIIL